MEHLKTLRTHRSQPNYASKQFSKDSRTVCSWITMNLMLPSEISDVILLKSTRMGTESSQTSLFYIYDCILGMNGCKLMVVEFTLRASQPSHLHRSSWVCLQAAIRGIPVNCESSLGEGTSRKGYWTLI